MTFEQKLIAGLEEIKAIIFECNNCKSRVTLTPENVETPPNQCPRGHNWSWDVPVEYQRTAGSTFMFFLISLKKLRDPTLQRAGFRILLEFDQPKP